MTKLTGGLLTTTVAMPLLGTAETLIGLALVTGLLLRPALILFFGHMTGVFTTLALLHRPDVAPRRTHPRRTVRPEEPGPGGRLPGRRR
ncbi:hypothetical protein LV779_15805 [Streptomyces thinghirensis]|nr:hypothetical protein [Streptomyces thinghirensis]